MKKSLCKETPPVRPTIIAVVGETVKLMKNKKQPNPLYVRLTDNLRTNLKALREKQSLSQAALAKESGVAVATVAEIEQGRKLNVTLETVAVITSGLGYKDPLKLLKSSHEDSEK